MKKYPALLHMFCEMTFPGCEDMDVDGWDAFFDGRGDQHTEAVYFCEDEKACGLYGRFSARCRSRSPEACIDPREFYGCGEMPLEKIPERRDCMVKPGLSYAQIITQALRTSSTGKLTLSEIYAWIENAFEYYRHANPVWKNSIRHNLSLNKCFRKVPRDPGTRGKGGRWTIDYDFLLKEEGRRRRRRDVDDASADESQDGSGVFCKESSETKDSGEGEESQDALDSPVLMSFMAQIDAPKNVNKV